MAMRLSDDQFDALIRTGSDPKTQEHIKRLNDEELAYLKTRAVSTYRQNFGKEVRKDGEWVQEKGAGTALQSATRLREMGEEPEVSKGASTESPGMLDASILNPEFYKAGAKNLKAAFLRDPSQASAGVQNTLMDMGQNLEETGVPAITPYTAENVPGVGQEARTVGNIGISAANLGIGMGAMGATGVEAVGKSAISAGAKILGKDKTAKEYGKESVEATEEFSGMVGEMILYGGAVGKDLFHWANYTVADAIGFEDYAERYHGQGARELIDMMEQDPVGTSLFAAGWLKGSIKFKQAALDAAGVQPKPSLGTLDRGKSMLKDPTAVIRELSHFEELPGRQIPEAHYTLDAVVDGPYGKKGVGDVASASWLRKQGFSDLGLQFDRRINRPEKGEYMAKRREFYQEMAIDAEQRYGVQGRLRSDQHAALWEAADKLTKEFYREQFKPERAERKRVMDEMGITEADIDTKFHGLREIDPAKEKAALKQLGKIVADEEVRLRSLRDAAVDAIRPEEIVEVSKKYPVAWNAARNKLMTNIRLAREGVQLKWRTFKSALYDEMQLIHPELTRKEIQVLNKKQARNYGEAGSRVDHEVAWMVDEIASARARRGQSNTPISHPMGRWKKTNVDIYQRVYERLQKFYKNEVAEGDAMAKPTAIKRQPGQAGAPATPKERMFGKEMPGEQKAPVEYVGDRNGIEMWQWQEDGPGMVKGKMVTTKHLKDLGYEIERPTMPKANGKQKAQTPKDTTVEQLEIDQTVAETLPDHHKGNLFVQNEARKGIQHVLNSMLDYTRPITMKIGRLPGGKQVMDLFNRWASSENHAGVKTNLLERKLDNILSRGGKVPKETYDAWKTRYARYLHDQKRLTAEGRKSEAQAIIEEMKTKKDAGDKLTKDDKVRLEWAEEVDVNINIPKMDPAELRAFKQTEPFKAIDQWYRKDVQPYIESWADEAGIKAELYTPDGLYVKSSYVTNLKDFGGDMKNVRVVQGEMGRQRNPSVRAMTKAQAARVFKGHIPKGMMINDNLGSLVYQTIRDRMNAGTKRNVIKEMTDRWAHDPKKFKAGDTVRNKKGESYRLKEIDLETYTGKGLLVRKKHLIPSEIVDTFNWMSRDHHSTDFGQFVKAWQGTMTGMALLTPAEATMHALNVVHASARLGGGGFGKSISAKLGGGIVGKSADIMTTYATQLGRVAGMAYDMASLSKAELAMYTERLSAVGGLRTYGLIPKQYRPKRTSGPVGKAVDWAHNLPGMHSIREAVFGMPGEGKGIAKMGIETRLRISTFKALEAMEPGMGDAHYANILNNHLGTYTAKLMPKVTEAMMNLDPFARAGTGMAKSGLKTVYGDMVLDVGKAVKDMTAGEASFRKYANTINAYTTVMTIAALNYQMSGYWPWEKENASLNPGDIRFKLDDGRSIDIPFAKLHNNAYRGMKYTGVIDTIKAMKHGERDPNMLTQEVIKSILNFGLSRVGPPLRAGFQAATLQTPYMTELGKAMDITEPTRDPADKMMNHVKAGLQPLFPIFSKVPYTKDMLGVREFSEKPRTWWGTAIRVMSESLGLSSYIRNEHYPLESMGFRAAKHEEQFQKTVYSIYQGWKKQAPEDRGDYLNTEMLDRFPDPAERYKAATQLISMAENAPENLIKRAMREEAMQRGINPVTLPE